MLSSCKLQFLHPSSQSNVPAGPVQSSSGHVFSNVVAFPSITGEIDVLGKPAESTAGFCAESQPVRDMSDGVFRSVVNPSLVEDLIENFEVHLHLLQLFRKLCQCALFYRLITMRQSLHCCKQHLVFLPKSMASSSLWWRL